MVWKGWIGERKGAWTYRRKELRGWVCWLGICIDGISLFLVLLGLYRLESSNWNTSTLSFLSAKRCRIVAIFYLPTLSKFLPLKLSIQNFSTLTFNERVENGKSPVRSAITGRLGGFSERPYGERARKDIEKNKAA